MSKDQQRAAFEAWAASIGFCVTGKYSETSQVLCAKEAFQAGWQAALTSPEVQALWDALEEIINCPQSVDDATVPVGGVEVNPAQVILTLSVSLVRIRKARAAIAAME